MLKDITLGQYFPGSSPVHKADPRFKMLSLILFLTAILIASSSYSFILSLFFMIALIGISKVPFSTVLKNLKSLIVLIIFTTFISLFITGGEGEPLFTWRFIKIYKSGIVNCVYLIIRFVCMLSGSFILISYTTLPMDLTDGIERLLSPLAKFKVPVHDFAMMISTALRFIPTFIEDTNKIISAQKARGADFESGGLIKRAKAFIPILIPLFASEFRRAGELAEAMECRCYNSGFGRTKMKEMKIHFSDFIFLFFFIALLAGVIALNKFELPFLV